MFKHNSLLFQNDPCWSIILANDHKILNIKECWFWIREIGIVELVEGLWQWLTWCTKELPALFLCINSEKHIVPGEVVGTFDEQEA